MTKDTHPILAEGRRFLKCLVYREKQKPVTDQERGQHSPPWQKTIPPASRLEHLPDPDSTGFGGKSHRQIVAGRKSHRSFKNKPVTRGQLSYLLWSSQGVRKIPQLPEAGEYPYRNVPSAGSRHPFETYLAIMNGEDLAAGLYRYIPEAHALLSLPSPADLKGALSDGTYSQQFAAEASVCFIWTALPYRTEWRYHYASHKVIAIDIGHVCQALYLAAECCQLGTCAVGSYHQEKVDKLLGVDGEEEFTILLAPVGTPGAEKEPSFLNQIEP